MPLTDLSRHELETYRPPEPQDLDVSRAGTSAHVRSDRTARLTPCRG